MEIAVLAPECSPSWGGVGSYTYNLIRNLPSNVTIHVITINRDIRDAYEYKLAKDNVIIHKIVNISPNDSFLYNLKFQLAVIKELKKLNSLYNFDIIHSHSGHLPHYFSQFQNIAPMIATVHAETKGLKNARKSIDCRKDSTESLHDFFSNVVIFGEKITFRKAERLIPISEFTMKQILSLYGIDIIAKSRVIHNGVDSALFKPEQLNEHKRLTIAFIGRLYAVKGIDIFLKTIRDLIKKKYDINLLIVGRGNENYIKSELSSLPQNSYSILGRVDYDEMPRVYQRCDVIVQPSLYEGCSGTLLEAMSCGKIVVASNIGGTPEIIKDGYNGFLCKPSDPKDLTSKLVNILEDTNNLQNIRNNARKTVLEKFCWADKAQQVFEEYKKIV